MKIKRGYSRKINLGNFENVDFWAEYEDELDETKDTDIKVLTKALHNIAKQDVEESIQDFWKQLEADIPDEIPLEEWEKMPEKEKRHHQEIKKARHRIHYHKDAIKKLGKVANKSNK